MKTNHFRNFKAKPTRRSCFMGFVKTGELSGIRISASFNHGSRRQEMRYKAGAKKYVRTRIRFHENQALKKLVTDPESFIS